MYKMIKMNQKNMKKCDKPQNYKSSKFRMIYVLSNVVRHPVAKTFTTLIVILIIIVIIIISFMQGIYTYIPETNHVPREYSVSAILSLLFMVSISLVPALALLYFFVSTFRSTGLFINPSGISELDCGTTKTYTAERRISIGR